MSVLSIPSTIEPWKEEQLRTPETLWIHPVFFTKNGQRRAYVELSETEDLLTVWQQEKRHSSQGEWILQKAEELLLVCEQGKNHLLYPEDFLLVPEQLRINQRNGALCPIPRLMGKPAANNLSAAVLHLLEACSETATEPKWNRYVGRLFDRIAKLAEGERSGTLCDPTKEIKRAIREAKMDLYG